MRKLTQSEPTLAAAEALLDHPDFRRATLNQRLAYAAAEAVLREIPTSVPRERIALVLGTRLGELAATYDFLSGLVIEKAARPLAFQNSLHHSTLGLISKVLQVTGPGLTTSRGEFSDDDALSTAELLLDAGDADYAIVVSVEAAPEKLLSVVQKSGQGRVNSATATLWQRS